jgi:hypothetical protein
MLNQSKEHTNDLNEKSEDTKKKRTKGQPMINKTLDRKQKIE